MGDDSENVEEEWRERVEGEGRNPKAVQDLVVAAMGPDERDIALKLKAKLNSEASAFDMVSEFNRYLDLIERPKVFEILRPNRERLLITLLGTAEMFREQVDSGEFPANIYSDSGIIDKIYHLQHLKSKMENIVLLCSRVMHDLPNVVSLEGKMKYVLEEVYGEEKSLLEKWADELIKSIRKDELSLREDDPVIEFSDGSRQMEVTYNCDLARVIDETQQLLILGYDIPDPILELSTKSKKFVKQARELDQIATFHNTIGDRMIPSQRPMMLETAVSLSQLVGEQNQVVWSNHSEVDSYINNLKGKVLSLAKQNGHLSSVHGIISSKIVKLYDADLIKQQQKWKECLKEVRDIFKDVERQGYKHMKSWQHHWDRQLYKVLEMQYIDCLSSLSHHLPDIPVEVVFRQDRLQFKPPLEELKTIYYNNVRKLINIPRDFKGILEESGDGEEIVFSIIIKRHAHRYEKIYIEGEKIFDDMVESQDKYYEWISLGSADMDSMGKMVLRHAEDWDRNFRVSKAKGQEIVRMNCADEKIGCFVVSYKLLRLEIELLNRKFWEVLVALLNNSIIGEMATMESFLVEGIAKLQEDPQTVEEITESNLTREQLAQDMEAYELLLDSIDKKNKTLATWTKEKFDLGRIKSLWEQFTQLMENYQNMIGRQVENLKIIIGGQARTVENDIENFQIRWEELKPDPNSEDITPEDIDEAVEFIAKMKDDLALLAAKQATLEEICVNLSMDDMEFIDVKEIKEDLANVEKTWSTLAEFRNGIKEFEAEDWIVFRVKPYRFDEYLQEWDAKFRKEDQTDFVIRVLQDLEDYKTIIPNLKYIRGDIFTEKHWYELFSLLSMPSKSLANLKLGDFLAARGRISEKIKELKELNARASGEVTVRQALSELDGWEIEAKFKLAENKDSNDKTIYIIQDFKSVLNKLGDNQSLLQSIRTSPFYSHFADRITVWETKLGELDEYIQNLNKVQRRWVYLEPIFSHGVLESEQKRFRRIDDDFRLIMEKINSDSRVSSLSKISGIRNRLNILVDQLSRCQNSLNEFLEKKRSGFPRFYFLGDDDLLEILGQSTKPSVIQAHLKKLFAGIYNVDFDPEFKYITAMKSLEGETVILKSQVRITNNVEEWLSELSNEMRYTLKSLLLDCVSDSKHESRNPNKYPSQILCLSNSIVFTDQCEEAIRSGRLPGLLTQLKKDLEAYTSVHIEDETTDGKVLELKLKDLILDIIHNIDVVEFLMQKRVKSVSDWYWQKQLRFYIRDDGDGTAIIRMADAEFTYSYEYQGNAPKLVHTPLTDKCYLTLTQGMRMGLGGNPYGPAGTGKTESVKALGSILGRQVLVFNCDEGIDVKAMGRIFMGLVKCGAWGCFDEFNRLEGATLSAVSMQIQPIQTAFKQGSPNVLLMDEVVPLDPNAGIFVTLNPAGQGYGGRNKLPDNLKQLFRPVVMSQPDNERIAEVILYTEGYKFAKTIGKKLVEVFKLSDKLLTRELHYDWGLRALKTVLKGCGSALKEFKRTTRDIVYEKEESDIVVSTLRLNTLPKLTYADCFRFDSLIKDVFPNVTFKDLGYHDLGENVRAVYKELALELNENQVRKCLELYEQLQQRMGVVIVGPPSCGKSTILKILKKALLRMGQQVKVHAMNPKAMPRTHLLGHINLDTRQWTDGVLTMKAQQVYSEPPDVISWIICDGDIDPEWIESLNSVLDDNRLLTLPSGWRIKFGPNVNFIFETHDLSLASPATISRMGMIFMSEEDADVKGIVASWLSTIPEDSRGTIQQLIDDYFYTALEWVLQANDTVNPWIQLPCVSVVQNTLSLMSKAKSVAQMAVTLIRGLGGHLSDKLLRDLTDKVLGWTQQPIPNTGSKLNLCYNQKLDTVEPYKDDILEEGEEFYHSSLPLVKTADVKRILSNIQPWLDNQESFILIGPEGCGKTMILENAFKELRSTEVAVIHCSSLISPENVLQKLSQICITMTTNAGRVYKSKDGERLILYFKDINLVKPDKWGTCQLVEFLRQIIVYQGFYDKNLEWVTVKGMQIVASISIGNVGGGRYNLSPRFTSRVRVCTMTQPEPDQLFTICHSYLTPLLKGCFSEQSIHHPEQIQALTTGMVKIYNNVRSNFTPVSHSHYQFTPRDLVRWVLGFMRYRITKKGEEGLKDLYIAWAYEACRLFRDKLVSEDEKAIFDNSILFPVLHHWGIMDTTQIFEGTCWISSYGAALLDSERKSPIPMLLDFPSLHKITVEELNAVVEKGITAFGRENRELNVVIVPELLQNVAFFDRILSYPGSSMVLAGRAGVGRRTALSIVAALHHKTIVTLKVGRNYSVKNFKTDLKAAIQLSVIEGNKIFLVVEDFQLVDIIFLDMLNSLLSSGEIPSLYSPEELEIIISSLRDAASSDGYTSSVYAYFASRVTKMMQIILIMDFTNENFIKNCQSNPALYKQCDMVWSNGWGDETMRLFPLMLINKYYNKGGDLCGFNTEYADPKRKSLLANGFQMIYNTMNINMAYPRRFVSLVHNQAVLYLERHHKISSQAERLKAGIAKLEEARSVVENLKTEASEQETILAEKQAEANKALEMITMTMQNANVQRGEMQKLRQKTLKESEVLTQKKKVIDAELAEIEPLVQTARSSVGNIKNESISEIRSLRAPPDIIRDILEGVLRLMGIRDMSWNSMKSFLAKRGVKDEIRNFDARTIDPSDREAVENTLKMKHESFEPKNVKRASAAAAPLAEWVTANVKYSKVLQNIEPLERQQQVLEMNLRVAESHMTEISSELVSVDERVQELKARLNQYTKEAAEIEFHLTKAKSTLAAAEGLVVKLNDEFTRWTFELKEMQEELKELPLNSLLAAAFITYLCNAPEDVRNRCLKEWAHDLERDNFDFCKFLSSERDLLRWQSLGLPTDRLSQENAIMILQTCLRPYLVDPSSRATEWLINHFSAIREPVVISLRDPKFTNELELAVRFGKILIIVEADVIEPILIPILRGDLVSQGSREIVCIGEKVVDYNPNFRLFLATRNPHPTIPPDAAAVLTVVNFTTTRAGLSSQLLSTTLSFEKPEIETKKTELVKSIESLKLQLDQLGESLLQGLASAQGNILENLELLDSLNKTKASSIAIANSLEESSTVEESLNKEIDVYRPFAEFGSRLYFGIVEVAQLNPMYQFSLASFIKLFQKTLQSQKKNESSVTLRIDRLRLSLLDVVYDYVCRALFKTDRMAFAMHVTHLMYSGMFHKKEWEAFTGQLIGDLKTEAISVPSWVHEDRRFPVQLLIANFPDLVEKLELDNEELWKEFYHGSDCEDFIPIKVKDKITKFQEVMLIHTLRPDRLHTSMYNFARSTFDRKSLFPPPHSIRQVFKDSTAEEPILMLVSSGADPSQEVRELAEATIGLGKYIEISMGQGEVDLAMQKLREAAQVGHWICMKNLHLVTHLLDTLEKEIRAIRPHENFRLWLTSEPHSAFPKILAQTCVKIAYEAPQGVKKNLQRTYSSWPAEYVVGDRNILRTQSLFVLAVFHAIVQERRTYIPQGWSTFYEFNDSDLRAGADVIEQLFRGSRSKDIQWNYIHGLFANAIYGGRVDNDYDNRVLVAYLTDYFNESILTGGNSPRKNFGPNIVLPTTTNASDYMRVIESIPENDKPFFFGLPSNIEKSWQRNTSSLVINQLKNLSRGLMDTATFDRNLWTKELTPLLNLWKQLHHDNNSMNILQEKITAPGLSEVDNALDPIESFVLLENYNITIFMQKIHKALGGVSKVIRGVMAPTETVSATADILIRREIPPDWRNIWEGPHDAQAYLTGLVGRFAAVKKWLQRVDKKELLKHPIDLADLLNPDTFFSAFKQYCARKLGVSMDALKFVCAWDRNTIPQNKLTCQLTGLLLEGCSFNGGRLQENASEDLPVTRIVDCTIAWLPPNENLAQKGATISVPLYANEMRKKMIGSLEMPSHGEDSKWIKTGIALFLKT